MADHTIPEVLVAEATAAGRRFRRSTRERALSWFASQQNTIGYPYLSSADYAVVQHVFLRAAGGA